MERILGKTVRILLVEDDPDTARATDRLLGRMGYDVKTVDTAKAAVEWGLAEKFDLLLCDLALPDGNGLNVYQQIRARQPIRGIIVSGFDGDDDVQRTLDAGCLAHLVKPIDFQTLHMAIKRAVYTPLEMQGSARLAEGMPRC
jgi:DNA-binding response OmpR family regulator